jgi:hypothetical protein
VYIGTVILYVLVERNVGVNVVLGLKLSSVVVDSASILQGRVHFLKALSVRAASIEYSTAHVF